MFPRYKNSYYRYPKRYNKSSVGKITQSRNFKASASNMTQNGVFSINVRSPLTLNIPANNNATWQTLDIPAAITGSDMHRQLSNVFDQYRIEKLTVRIKPVITTDPTGSNNSLFSYLSFFSCVDRSGFSNSITLAQLRTYSSYKETNWAANGGDTPRSHVINIGQADLVSRTEYYDTKSTAKFPTVCVGYDVGQTVTDQLSNSFTVEIDAQVRYRGVRLDTSNVSTRISSSF